MLISENRLLDFMTIRRSRGAAYIVHSTEEAFLLPTQQPQLRIPAPSRFFLFTAEFVDRIENKLI